MSDHVAAKISDLLHMCDLIFRRGYSEDEIEAAFAKYDLDGDKVLNEEEQRKMQDDLEGQRVCLMYCKYMYVQCMYVDCWVTYVYKLPG